MEMSLRLGLVLFPGQSVLNVNQFVSSTAGEQQVEFNNQDERAEGENSENDS